MTMLVEASITETVWPEGLATYTRLVTGLTATAPEPTPVITPVRLVVIRGDESKVLGEEVEAEVVISRVDWIPGWLAGLNIGEPTAASERTSSTAGSTAAKTFLDMCHSLSFFIEFLVFMFGFL